MIRTSAEGADAERQWAQVGHQRERSAAPVKADRVHEGAGEDHASDVIGVDPDHDRHPAGSEIDKGYPAEAK